MQKANTIAGIGERFILDYSYSDNDYSRLAKLSYSAFKTTGNSYISDCEFKTIGNPAGGKNRLMVI